MRTLITAAHIYTPEDASGQTIVVEDGLITAIVDRAGLTSRTHDQHLDFPVCTLMPAFFDVHTHGCAGRDVMEATADAFHTITRFLASRGVGAFFPTTVTDSMDATKKALSGIAALIKSSPPGEAARPAGIHLEGPFLSHAKRGVHPPQLLQEPSIEKFDELWQASEGNIRLMTIAPELPNAADLITHATALGVRISLGHSDANAAQTRTAIASGATSATHTFNAMRALNHREPGIAGVVLDDSNLFAEIICDGLHVAPEIVRLFWRAKGPDRAILVTDSMSAAGMPDGTYKLGGLDVTVSAGACTLDGVLAGSTLTMDRAVENFRTITGARHGAVAALAARNPARMAGLDEHIGTLAPGRRADIVALKPNGEVAATILDGRIAFRR